MARLSRNASTDAALRQAETTLEIAEGSEFQSVCIVDVNRHGFLRIFSRLI